jgi:hypothetical protein
VSKGDFNVWNLLKLGVAVCVLLVWTTPAATEPDAQAEADVDGARALIDELDPADAMLINALRYLMRPRYETELLPEDRHAGNVLTPFEAAGLPGMDAAHKARLLAVMQSGMPVAQSILSSHSRSFLGSPLPSSDSRLGPYALDLLVAGALIGRLPGREAAEVRQRAERVLAASESRVRAGSSDEFRAGNLMWRALIARAAVALDMEPRSSILRQDVNDLARLLRALAGGLAEPRALSDAATDEALFLLTALANFEALPERTIGSSSERTLERLRTEAADVLRALHVNSSNELFADVRSALVMSWPLELAPPGMTARVWRQNHGKAWAVARFRNQRTPTGAVFSLYQTLGNSGLVSRGATFGERDAVATSFAVIGLSGGLLNTEPGPLAAMDLGRVGRTMHAFTVIHRAEGTALAGPFHILVGRAIDRGCEWLLNHQNADGSFQGNYASHSGNTALALLALLHGGLPRNHPGVERGFAWLTAQLRGTERAERARPTVGTYSAGIALMAYQKYYEAEQGRAGVLTPDSPQDYRRARQAMRRLLSSEHREAIDAALAELEGARVGPQGWGYRPTRDQGGRGDNSNSQYALLGYKAACLLGCEVPDDRFRDEAERLVSTYRAQPGQRPIEVVYDDSTRAGGSTAVIQRAQITPGGWGYTNPTGGTASLTMQMTAAGMGSLAICLDELDARGVLTRAVAMSLVKHIKGAEVYIAGQYPTEDRLARNDYVALTGVRDGFGLYYNLYAVERACMLADVRLLDARVDWYRIGADALIQAQASDGGWSMTTSEAEGVHTVNVCKAILFLRRATLPVITEHRRVRREADQDPEPEDKPKPPVTGR